MEKRLQPRQEKRSVLPAILIICAVLLVTVLLDNILPANTFTLMLIPVLRKGAIYSLVCVSMNLLNGFTGLFSLGQAGFMLIGAYAYSIFSIPADQHAAVYQYFEGGAVRFSIPEMLSGVLGPNLGSFLGAIICIIIAVAIATLGFAEIIRAVFQWNGLGRITNGSNLLRKYTAFTDINLRLGSLNIKLATFFPFLIAILSITFIVLLINSTYGRAFKAIRDDEVAAEAMGINLFRHKMYAFIVSSFFAGVGGALLAMFQTTVQAAAFKTAMTYEILLMVVIGGIGSISGSCIAAFLYIACSEWWLRFLDGGKLFGMSVPFFRDGFRKVVFSVIIMIIVLFFRKGIMGDRELSFRRKPRQSKGKEAGANG